MTPLEYAIAKLQSRTVYWIKNLDEEYAKGLCAIMEEVAKRSARHFPKDTIIEWKDQVRLIESDVMDWFFPFAVSLLAQTADRQAALRKIEDRLRLYQDMAREDEARAKEKAA